MTIQEQPQTININRLINNHKRRNHNAKSMTIDFMPQIVD